MVTEHATRAAVLNVIIPGAGHLYLGKARRFFWFALVLAFVYLALALGGRLSTFGGMATYLLLSAGVIVYGVVDSYFQARKSGRAPRWYSRWYAIVGWLIFLLVASQLIIAFRAPVLGYAMFRVPTNSMAPTVAAGDYVLMDTHRHTVPAANSIVAVLKPELGGIVLRRVHGSPGPGVFRLSSDKPLSPQSDAGLDAVPANLILGRITSVFWSPSRRQFGIKVP